MAALWKPPTEGWHSHIMLRELGTLHLLSEGSLFCIFPYFESSHFLINQFFSILSSHICEIMSSVRLYVVCSHRDIIPNNSTVIS